MSWASRSLTSVKLGTPYLAPTPLAREGLRSLTPDRAIVSALARAGRCATWAIRPQPITPSRSGWSWSGRALSMLMLMLLQEYGCR